MTYVIQAVLRNPRNPESGQITIPFPISPEHYDQTIKMLQEMDLGYSINRDCVVDEIDSRYPVLETLKGTMVNIDQIDYLAKFLDSFSPDEDSKFNAMSHKLGLAHIADFINLALCCQQATVITDFSKLEEAGKAHRMNLNGGSISTAELEAMDGQTEALRLIESGTGTITPYGVVYDNGMVLEQLYNGRQFPEYLYGDCLMVLELRPKKGLREGQNPEYLYLPASEHQIKRTLLRAGGDTFSDMQIKLDFHTLPDKVAEALDMESLSGDDLPGFNRMCRAIMALNKTDAKKLEAVVLMTETSGTVSICRLAENLDQFDFIPGIRTPEEYGRYMIRQSGHFEYDENLEGFYDCRNYGEQRVRQEGGQFNECGYVAYRGEIPLEDLLREGPAEQRQTGPQMGGLS